MSEHSTMRWILDTNKIDQAEIELGAKCEQLLTPLTRFANVRPDQPFAIDNGAFTRFDERGFLTLLERELPRQHLCRFVAVPDVIAAGRNGEPIGNARLTLRVFDHWKRQLTGWPLAMVAQDGAEELDLPWYAFRALFIGGSTAWKDGPHAAALVKTAKMLGKWVHVGRVNCPARFEHFSQLGADSCDGSGVARTTRQRVAIRDRHSPSPLFTPETNGV